MAMFASFGVAHLTAFLFERFRERKADDYPIQHATEEQLLRGRRFFKAECLIDDVFKSSHRNDVHPSKASRLEKIEAALAKRQIAIPKGIDEELKIFAVAHIISDRKLTFLIQTQPSGERIVEIMRR